MDDEVVWFIGEQGVLQCADRSKMTFRIEADLRSGILRRVQPDGSPWTGPIFAPAPLPEPEETTIGTLRGYRAWSVSGTGALTSHGSFAWPADGWAQATCRHCDVVPSQEKCQDFGYGCGLY